jgi:hypothetical protein
MQAFDIGQCHCSSRYTDPWGRSRHEMDGFEWTPFDRVLRRSARHLGVLLTQTLSLPVLLARLQGGAGAAAVPRFAPRSAV